MKLDISEGMMFVTIERGDVLDDLTVYDGAPLSIPIQPVTFDLIDGLDLFGVNGTHCTRTDKPVGLLKSRRLT